MAPQVVLITGEGSNVGKTTLGTNLAKEATRRGLKVCVVKHVHHGVDYRIKDTGRYLEAGADTVAAIGPQEVMIVEKARKTLWDMLQALQARGCSLILVEGLHEEAEEVLKRGGCVAYIGQGRAESTQLVTAEPQKALQALPKLVELIARNKCQTRID